MNITMVSLLFLLIFDNTLCMGAGTKLKQTLTTEERSLMAQNYHRVRKKSPKDVQPKVKVVPVVQVVDEPKQIESENDEPEFQEVRAPEGYSDVDLMETAKRTIAQVHRQEELDELKKQFEKEINKIREKRKLRVKLKKAEQESNRSLRNNPYAHDPFNPEPHSYAKNLLNLEPDQEDSYANDPFNSESYKEDVEKVLQNELYEKDLADIKKLSQGPLTQKELAAISKLFDEIEKKLAEQTPRRDPDKEDVERLLQNKLYDKVLADSGKLPQGSLTQEELAKKTPRPDPEHFEKPMIEEPKTARFLVNNPGFSLGGKELFGRIPRIVDR